MTANFPAPPLVEDGQAPSGILQILIRRRWYFLGPFFAIGLGAYAIAHIIPLPYRSTAFILVEQQKVPEQYVASNIFRNWQKRLDSMTQQILSRTRLQRFIDDFGLYASERKRMPMDEVIDMMRKRASVELVQTKDRQGYLDLSGLRVYFSDPNPYVAQRVANELTSLFIDLDLRERTSQSQQTAAFLENQLEEAGKRLAAYEQQLRQYKISHLGELPDQLTGNLSMLASLDAQLRASTSARERADQQRIYLEAMRARQESLKRFSTSSVEPAASAPASNSSAERRTDGEPVGGASLELAQITLAGLWKQLADLTAKFTDRHPEVIRLKREIADWESIVDRLGSERAAQAELESRLKAVLAEIESERAEGLELRRRIREAQDHISQIPVREQELAKLNRLLENEKTYVESLLQKKQGSELTNSLEQSQGGERFRLLDAATLPRKPQGRSKIIVVGWILAAEAGAGLTFLREIFDHSVHKPRDLKLYPSVPVLARIPTVRSAVEEHRRRLRHRLEAVAVGVILLICLGSGAETYLQR